MVAWPQMEHRMNLKKLGGDGSGGRSIASAGGNDPTESRTKY